MNFVFNPLTGNFDSIGPNSYTISEDPPPNPIPGDKWWYSVEGMEFIYYDDGTSAQWVSTNSNNVGFLPAGSITEIQFNDDGVLGSDPSFTFDKSTGEVSAPAARYGDLANYLYIGPDGTLRLYGMATVWDDLTFPATMINPSGATLDPPTFEQEHGWALFPDGSIKLFATLVQMPHRWKAGSRLYPHVHWHKTTTGVGDVTWRLEYKWANIGDVLDANWTTLESSIPIAVTADTNTTRKHLITDWPSIDATGKTISSMLLCRVSRVGSGASDTYGGDAALLSFDIHIEIDSLGSSTEYSK